MSKILELEKRGCDFCDDKEREESDLENFRLGLSFTDKNGVEVCGDVCRGRLFSYYLKNGRERVKPKLISEWGLFTSFQHETADGTFGYTPKIPMGQFRYTKKDVLLLINEISNDNYTEIKIIE